MIKKETYTSEWIKAMAKANRNADPILVEKVIRALCHADKLVLVIPVLHAVFADIFNRKISLINSRHPFKNSLPNTI